MTLYLWAGIIVLLLLIVIIYSSFFFSNLAVKPKVVNYEETYKFDVAEGKINEDKYNSSIKEELYIKSPYGYKLHGLFFPNKDSKKVMIICHGYTWSLFGSIKYMDMFFKHGFSVLLYDHRHHGLSGGNDTSFGYYEKYDLKAWVDWVINRFGNDTLIGLHGESMGCGISLETLAIDNRIKFCVADCGYSDVFKLFKYQLGKNYKIKHFPLVALSSKVTKLKNGWSFKDVSPIKSMPSIETPILFIHGANDDFIPPSMSEEMYKAKKGYKEIYISPNAGHAQSFWVNKEEYEKRVDDFLKAINVI